MAAAPAEADPAADGGWGARLVTQGGTPLGGEMLKGRPYAIYFGYLRCPEVCPTSLADMTQLLARLDRSGAPDAARALQGLFRVARSRPRQPGTAQGLS